jgi:hypothetical protein
MTMVCGVALDDHFVRLKPPAKNRGDAETLQRVEVHLLEQHALGSSWTSHREVGLAHRDEPPPQGLAVLSAINGSDG